MIVGVWVFVAVMVGTVVLVAVDVGVLVTVAVGVSVEKKEMDGLFGLQRYPVRPELDLELSQPASGLHLPLSGNALPPDSQTRFSGFQRRL